MSLRTGLVTAFVGGLLLQASGARGGENALESPRPGVDQPAAVPSVQPIHSGWGSDPALEPLMQPTPTPSSVPAPPLASSGPTMIHQRRPGLVVAGAAILVPVYALQMLLSFGVTLSGIDGAPPGNYGQAGLLTLIPILGPWLGPSSVGEPLDTRLVLAWGGIEAAAIAMIIAGEVGHDVPQGSDGSKVSLAPFVTPAASGLSVRMHW